MTVAVPSHPADLWTGPVDYHLPDELIAQYPAVDRARARLMVIDRASGSLSHECFGDIGSHLVPGDLLVLNDTKVVPARLKGRRASGGRVEVLVLSFAESPSPVMYRSSKKLQQGETIGFAAGYMATVCAPVAAGRTRLDFGATDILTVLNAVGEIPLPPYIHRNGPPSCADKERYQTVYARCEGSVAAPTAGLHFTTELLAMLEARGVYARQLTLHVGPGTFAPIRDAIAAHRMEAEHCEVSAELVAAAVAARHGGGRIVAVGTTSVRALETAARGGALDPFVGPTDLFLRPGHEFLAVDALVTNFHLPRSTLLCLVMAFAGEALVRRAYEIAVAERYRFYSFGDAMLIV